MYEKCKIQENQTTDAPQKISSRCLIGCLVLWVYGISSFVGYLTPNPFYANSQFYFKQFSLALAHSLNRSRV